MEAIQAGNKLAAIQIKEAQETRALMATYLQQEMAKTQKREKIEQVQEEAKRKLYGKTTLSQPVSTRPPTDYSF